MDKHLPPYCLFNRSSSSRTTAQFDGRVKLWLKARCHVTYSRKAAVSLLRAPNTAAVRLKKDFPSASRVCRNGKTIDPAKTQKKGLSARALARSYLYTSRLYASSSASFPRRDALSLRSAGGTQQKQDKFFFPINSSTRTQGAKAVSALERFQYNLRWQLTCAVLLKHIFD